MFDLSFAEIVLVIVVAVIFIGPKELPVVIRGLAKMMRGLRAMTRDIKKSFDDLAEESGLKDDITMIKGDDGKWYESYPVSSPSRGEVGRGASTVSPSQVSPHPNPPPTGEGEGV